jgi:hypothetical protein
MVKKNVFDVNVESQKPLKVDAMESFMNDVFENHLVAKTHLDTKINWLMGISGLTMSLLIPYLHSVNPSLKSLGLYVILFTTMITFFICLLSLQLPRFLIKHKHEEHSVMFYNRGINYTPEKIYEELKGIRDYDDVLKQYSIALYNLIERNIKIKDKLFKMSAYVLLAGLSIGFILILFTI